MKKILLTLTVGFCLGLTACGGGTPTEKPAGKDKDTVQTENKKTEVIKKDGANKEDDKKAPNKPIETRVDDDVSEK